MHRASAASETGGILAQAVTCPALSALPGIKHGFFTRRGGASAGVYASLNCAIGTGDSPENVAENYRRITKTLGVAETSLCKAYQIHSATAVIADKAWRREEAPQADAIVTNVPGLAVGVTTADCLPILLADEKNRVIAAAHAGWKGAISGILEATLEKMQALGARAEDIIAAIGPAIAQASYEIGEEFYERFLADDEGNARYFIHGARPGHWLFDLKSYAKDRLRDAGVNHITILAHDTCAEEADFFSYRRSCLRGETAYGCQLSGIILE
ncbi:MAG: peptidoglycan editing factor PgeF [Pseudomonadota bacterium]|nr:peptidoglycan editing factor PgeF [Pseudomonadota bacterium]